MRTPRRLTCGMALLMAAGAAGLLAGEKTVCLVSAPEALAEWVCIVPDADRAAVRLSLLDKPDGLAKTVCVAAEGDADVAVSSQPTVDAQWVYVTTNADTRALAVYVTKERDLSTRWVFLTTNAASCDYRIRIAAPELGSERNMAAVLAVTLFRR
jgi:hypothetical protein